MCYLLLLQLGACAKHTSTQAVAGPTASGVPAPASFAAAPAVLQAAEAPSGDLDFDHSAAKVPVTWNDPIWGHADAPVTIVEFTDYQCPFCSRVMQTIEQVRNKYGPSKVRIVTLHNPLPFHKQAYPAAVAATAVFQLAGSYAFYRFTDFAFANQAALSDESYEKWATASGIDLQAFRKAIASEPTKRKVDADMALAKQLGISGTPSFRINGVTLSGAQPFDRFASVIDEQLAQAKLLLQSGTPPNKVYVALTNKNAEVTEAAAPTTKPTPPEEDTAVYRVPVLADDPVLGPAGARVTIVVFSDFQCPFCKRVEPTLKQIREQYGDNVRFVWKDLPLPFHPQAMPAAVLGRLVYAKGGNQAFWAVHDELFESQPDLGNTKLEALARKHGVAFSRVQAELSGGLVKGRIEASSQMAEDYNARGTPNFFINGVKLTGAQPFEKFKERIDAELEKAKALTQLGVNPEKLYEELTKIGKAPAEPERKLAPAAKPGRPSRGPKNAVVVIQEWADFQCPFCKRVEAELQSLQQEFPTQVRIVWRHLPLPFHNYAPLAAEAAEEALAQGGNAAFWKFHDRLMAESAPEGLSEPNLQKIAKELGLNTARFQLALANHTHSELVQADSKLAESIGISGTPAFVINGYFVSGAQPLAVFRSVVKRALADAKVKPVASAGSGDPTLAEIQAPPANATRTESGLVYFVLRSGTGKKHPADTNKLRVHYSGWTTDGKLFDSSVTRGQPFTFQLGQVIRGWAEGVKQMVVGEKTRFWIPPELAYGDIVRPGVPAGTLVFDVELLAIE